MTTIHYESVNELVNYYLKKRKMTQKDLCKIAGIGPATMTNIKTGKSACSYELLQKIFKALGIGKVYITVIDQNDELLKVSIW